MVKKDNILYESDNFFVVPSIGQIEIEGYLLLCSKKHFEGVGGSPAALHSELEETLNHTRLVLTDNYNSEVLAFEHGPRIGCWRGGGCLDHAHLHLVPIALNLMEPLALRFLNGLQIKDYYAVERIDEFGRLSEISEKEESSYLFVETNDSKRYITRVSFTIPSQYLRQIIAHFLKKDDLWNWKRTPDYETFDRTMTRLSGKF